MSDKFEVPSQHEGIIELIDDDKVRFNFTLPREFKVLYRKDCTAEILDLAKLDGFAALKRLIEYGIKQHCTDGAPTTQKLSQVKRPTGDEWKGKLGTFTATGQKGDKGFWTRQLSKTEKEEHALGHCLQRIEVLYGLQSLQDRVSSRDPIAEEFRKLVLRWILKKNLSNSDGEVFTRKNLPGILTSVGAISTDIGTEAESCGIPAERILKLQENAKAIVDLMQDDDELELDVA